MRDLPLPTFPFANLSAPAAPGAHFLVAIQVRALQQLARLFGRRGGCAISSSTPPTRR